MLVAFPSTLQGDKVDAEVRQASQQRSTKRPVLGHLTSGFGPHVVQLLQCLGQATKVPADVAMDDAFFNLTVVRAVGAKPQSHPCPAIVTAISSHRSCSKRSSYPETTCCGPLRWSLDQKFPLTVTTLISSDRGPVCPFPCLLQLGWARRSGHEQCDRPLSRASSTFALPSFAPCMTLPSFTTCMTSSTVARASPLVQLRVHSQHPDRFTPPLSAALWAGHLFAERRLARPPVQSRARDNVGCTRAATRGRRLLSASRCGRNLAMQGLQPCLALVQTASVFLQSSLCADPCQRHDDLRPQSTHSPDAQDATPPPPAMHEWTTRAPVISALKPLHKRAYLFFPQLFQRACRFFQQSFQRPMNADLPQATCENTNKF